MCMLEHSCQNLLLISFLFLNMIMHLNGNPFLPPFDSLIVSGLKDSRFHLNRVCNLPTSRVTLLLNNILLSCTMYTFM